MSIADELRVWASRQIMARDAFDTLLAIADRIDAEHEREVGEKIEAIRRDVEEFWTLLPRDADGEPIHVGDVMDYLEALHPDVPARFKVQDMFYCGNGKWHLRAYPATYDPMKCRHHHAPTVEDVLREFGDWYAHTKGGCDEDGIIAEYAAKLQLREDV